jgi:NADPH:quinone reductase-like Zn-dependent oxidoreductase
VTPGCPLRDIALVHGEGLAGQITEALGGAELQLVIDGEGGSTVSALAASLRRDGTVVAFSSITAQPQQIQFGDLL